MEPRPPLWVGALSISGVRIPERLIPLPHGVTLAAETFGDQGPWLVLVMGLGAQMILWPDELCQGLADRGFRVLRFDNRDVGRSSRLDALGAPDPLRISLGWLTGRPPPAPYPLDALAADAVALLDVLEIERAHVVGASMGGMVAQLLAIGHPERLGSLTSIMSTPSLRAAGTPDPRVLKVMLSRPEPTRDAVVRHLARTYAAIGSPVHPADPDELRALADRCYDRGLSGAGFFRHLAAIVASEDRTEALGAVRLPSLVIHGALDPLIRPSGGAATARAIPGARHLLVRDMAHDLPRPLWPVLIDAVAGHARSAEGL